VSHRRRFGSLRKLPSGRWQVRYLGPDGKTRKAPDTFRTKTDADRFLAAVEVDMGRGSWLDPDRSDVQLGDYAKGWIKQRTVRGRPLAARTLDTYQHSLKAWIEPGLGAMPVGRITPAIVRTWHAEVSAQTGPTATRQAYALLRAILSTAVEDGALHRNPCSIRGAGSAVSPERPLLSPEDVDNIAAAMPMHLKALVPVSCWAALRLGEVLALRVGDIDLDKATLRVERQILEVDGVGPVEAEPKVGSVRTVYLPQQAIDALTTHLATRSPALPTARVFVRRDGTDLRAHHVHAAWKTARKNAGYPDAHLHDLRHAGLTLAAQSGATLAEVMRRAGHVSARAAMIYQHAAESRDKELAERLSALSDKHKRGRTGT
jgi:integrase